MRARRLLAGVLAGVGAVLAPVFLGSQAGAAPAEQTGEERINIDHVQVSDDGRLSLLLAVDTLGASAAPTAADIAVSVGGVSPEDFTVEAVKAGAVERTVVLALDASLSMRAGNRWEAAKQAAKAYLAAAPADIEVGLLTFSGGVQETVPPTTDHDSLVPVIDGLRLTLGTTVYDAVIGAVDLTGDQGARSVLLLSDGEDQGNGSPLPAAVSAAEEAGVVVDVVALEQDAASQAVLSEISTASGGQVIAADSPAALRGVFTAQADALSEQLLVTFPVPEGVGAEESVEVTVTADGVAHTDAAFVALPEAPAGPKVVVPTGSALGTTALLAGAAALMLGLAGLLTVVLIGQSRESAAQRRLAGYFGAAEAKHRVEMTKARGGPDHSLKASVVNVAERAMKADFESRLNLRLTRAGLGLTPAEWLLTHVGIAILAGFVGMVLGGPALMVLLLLLGAVLPWLFLSRKRSKRQGAFNSQLAETLTLVSGGLRAGLSLPQAVDSVVREGVEPMAGELRRALGEQRLGIPVEDALESVGVRMDSQDFAWVVMAIRIQREVGGNLSELLTTVAATIRERDYLRRQVKVLSAEGRMSAWVLGALPILLFAYMMFVRPDYASIFFSTLPGLAMLAGAVVMLVLGFVVLFKVVKVEV